MRFSFLEVRSNQSLRSAVVAVALMSLLSAGCDAPQAQFSWRQTTEEQLISDAQKAVKKTVNDRFGTPHDLVAWERLPVTYGGVTGKVVAVSDEDVKVEFEGNPASVTKGADLKWVTGALAEKDKQGSKVQSYDAKTTALTWTGVQGTPAVGDICVVAGGETLKLGRAVYMKNCMHCHGVSGDGNGPTAQFLNPRPRDYRLGLFKFKSTRGQERINREDLTRIIKQGIPGTLMPSFLLLGDDKTKAVVEYIRWLSMRGELEKRIDDDLKSDYTLDSIKDAANNAAKAAAAAQKEGDKTAKAKGEGQLRREAADAFKAYLAADYESMVNETTTFITDGWVKAEEESSLVVPTVPRVTDDAASRNRGRLLYLSDKAKCYTCHGFQGKGDGAATEDFWPIPGETDKKYANRGLHNLWGEPLQPRNLTLGQYRGGRRPIDVFRRVHAGIQGTPMPGFGGAIPDKDLWDIVNYVMSLPYASGESPVKTAAGSADGHK